MTVQLSPPRPTLVPETIETLEEDHAIQRALCADLEAVADRLPAFPPLPQVRRLCDRILCVTDTHFPRAESIFRALPLDNRPAAPAMTELHEMHLLDALHGQDLVASLWSYAGNGGSCGVGQLSYMLRCFFDGCRRAIALKESWIAISRR